MEPRGAVLCGLLLLCLLAAATGANQRRCVVCRSRGSLGDCRGPFSHNGTQLLAGGVRGVSVEPCASGWCGKIIEGDKGVNDYDTATERICMQRPPSDLKERCDETMYGPYRKVYLCMCIGDVCNTSSRPRVAAAGLVIALLASVLAR